MRIPKVHEYHLEKASTKSIPKETIQVDFKPSEYVDDISLFEDEKELNRFVVRTKYYIRKSLEYKNLMRFLKKYRGMYKCGIHPNLNMYDGFKIEIHHSPLVMEDIIYIIINKRIKCNESMKQSAIAKEVMYLHYMGLIGLYPLCESCHTFTHSDNNNLFIPFDALFGDPEAFFEIYKEFISAAMRTKFNNLKDLNTGYNMIQREIPDELVRKYIYVERKGQEVITNKSLADFLNRISQD